jgi:hypothetical protein
MFVRKGKSVDTVKARHTLLGVCAKREGQKGKEKKGRHRESNSVQKAAGGPFLGELLGAHCWENCWGTELRCSRSSMTGFSNNIYIYIYNIQNVWYVLGDFGCIGSATSLPSSAVVRTLKKK